MHAVVANLGLFALLVLSIYAPAVLWATFRPISRLELNLAGLGSLLFVILVSYVVAWTHHGVRGAMVAVGLLEAVVLVVGLARAVSRRPILRQSWAAFQTLVAGVVAAVLTGVPPLFLYLVEHSTGGFPTQGNIDVYSYALTGTNLLSNGFGDSGHLLGIDLGLLTRGTYIGAVDVVSYAAAIVGAQVPAAMLPAMMLAVVMAAVALAFFAGALWPALASRYAALIGLLAALPSLASYVIANYYLGFEFGLPCVATIIGCAFVFGRTGRRLALVGLPVALAAAIYCYAPLGVICLVASPVLVVVAVLAFAAEPRRVILWRAVAGVAASVVGAGVASLYLSMAWDTLTGESSGTYGWTLPPLDALSAVVYPPGIGLGSVLATRQFVVVTTWVAAAIVAGLALLLVRRTRRVRRSSLIAALAAAGAVLVMAVTFHRYGSSTYQTWKMESYLLPIVMAAVVPALALLRRPLGGLGRHATFVLAGAIVLNPILVWSPILTDASALTPATESTPEIRQSLSMPQVRRLVAVNIRVPGDLHTEMAMAAWLPKTKVVFTDGIWAAPSMSPGTCTLTLRSALAPSDTNYVPLVGDYVLLNRPASCQYSGTPAPTVPYDAGAFVPAVSASVTAGTSGEETDGQSSSWWWFNAPTAVITVTNTADSAHPVQVTATARTPCGQSSSLTLQTSDGPMKVAIDPSTGTPVKFAVSVPANGSVQVPVAVHGTGCNPSNDARTLYAGLFALTATQGG